MQLTRSNPKGRLDSLTWAILGLGVLGAVVGFFMAMSSPPDQNQGFVARIFHMHVPTAWMAYMASFGALFYSVAYLVRRQAHFDRVAAAAVEVGLIFMALALLTGMLWARPTWGVYWDWEPRLTTTAILFAIYVGYMVVRGAIEDPELRAKAAAGVAILGAINVPISYMSVKWWRSLHQTQSIDLTTGKIMVDSAILIPMLVNLAAFTLLYIGMVRLRGIIAAREAAQEEA
ncbi:Heme exporter protein C [Meiothermus luteus]|jgi:heme exporter protein C|uniref:Heme exporter protein C n=1 Tax=Meiothermus luteus TaxID=2026184 RepID=A0A399ESF4_9DEIN|nr:cytochrome c biogenesis protein CcsA [Meiothermus luteus]RIH86735.1 Heme exporter protein C [Meiothermus luteus]RMH54174.1 MAG: cytochrome C assembly protein [Deinococcota bacterium]